MSRLTLSNLLTKIKNKEKLVCLTAYTAREAKIIDSEVDMILVGDSLAMTIYGEDSTLNVNLQTMINHGKAVVNNSSHAFVIVDMPFASYQVTKELAFRNASKLISKTNANAIKLEAGSELADTVKFITERGIPVIGHIGLMPQHYKNYGGYKIQGKDKISEKKIINDAVSVSKAGASLIVVEGVKESIVKKIKAKIKTPLIGIGASIECEGQVLVIDDLLGMSQKLPKFAKSYVNLSEETRKAVSKFSKDVKEKKFPEKKHVY